MADKVEVKTEIKSTPAQAKYPVAEIVKASKKLFGYTGALVETALKETGKQEFTLAEAELIVKKFAVRPIKK